MEIECGWCEGTGEEDKAPCEGCHGTGVIEVDADSFAPDTWKEAEGLA